MKPKLFLELTGEMIIIDKSRSCGLNILPYGFFGNFFTVQKGYPTPPEKIKGTAKPYNHTESILEVGLTYFIAIWEVTGPWPRRGQSATSREIISVFRRVNKTHKPSPYSDKPANTRWTQVQRFYWHKVIPFTCCLLKRRLLSDCGKIILY